MFTATKRQSVHKTGLLHLPAMSGDDMHKLSHLMQDTKSEFSKNIKSYNMAVNATMNRHLSQALRDVNTTIESLNRSQQSTYKSMCRIINIQKKTVKETYQHYQQNLRAGEELMSSTCTTPRGYNQVKRRAVQGQKLPPLEESKPETHSQQINPLSSEADFAVKDLDVETSAVSQTQNSHQPDEPKSDNNSNNVDGNQPAGKVKESTATKDEYKLQDAEMSETETAVPDATLTTVQSSPPKLTLSFPSRSSTKKAFFTASLRPTLPPINETIGSARGKMDEDTKKPQSNSYDLRRLQQVYAVSSKGGGSSIGRGSMSPAQSTNDTVVSAQKAMSLRARIANLEKKHMEEFLKKQNLESKPKPYEIKLGDTDDKTASELSSTDKTTPSIDRKITRSIAVERRRLAKLRAAHRKALLNSEDNYQFIQMSDGSFMQGATAYKRKRFLPPSNRAQQERNQILKSEAAKVEMNDEKIGEFFNKLNLPVPTEITKVHATTNIDSKKALKKRETKAVLDLLDIVPVVSEPKPMKREKSVLPLHEVAKNITYIRQYVRASDRPVDVPHNTSWSQHN